MPHTPNIPISPESIPAQSTLTDVPGMAAQRVEHLGQALASPGLQESALALGGAALGIYFVYAGIRAMVTQTLPWPLDVITGQKRKAS